MGYRHFLTQTAHLAQVIRVHRVNHAAGAQEQERLETGVSGQMNIEAVNPSGFSADATPNASIM